MGDYNGWTNYETWAVNLHVTSDQGALEIAQEMAGEYEDRLDLADAIQEWIEGWAEIGIEQMPGLAADLLRGALSEVNWYEIAGAWMDDREEVEA